MKKIIELKGITKEFDGEMVLSDLDLDIYDKQFITLLGPSGCGKTTTLRIIGGFEQPDSGEVFFEGKKIKENIELMSAEDALMGYRLKSMVCSKIFKAKLFDDIL